MFNGDKGKTASLGHSRPMLGYRVVNPHDPPSVPRRLEPLNPAMQRKAEELFHLIANAP